MSFSRDQPVSPRKFGGISALLAELVHEPPKAAWQAPLVPGERVGRFEIVREIGRGGFGVVYEARDTELGRRVALKTVRTFPGAADDGALAEAEIAARLPHPNIVQLYDVGRCDHGAFLVLELLRGAPLRERLRGGRISLAEALRIAIAVARGAAHAHRAGIVHRDLTPANVFLCDDGQVKIFDFGLARLLEHRSAGAGTPGYMAPEQLSGAGDARSDVYALGVLLHELVIGGLPRASDGGDGLAIGERLALRDAPARLNRVVARMLSRDPAHRPVSAEEVLNELVSIERTLALRPVRLAFGAAAAIALLAVGAAVWPRGHLPRGRAVAVLARAANATGDARLDDLSSLVAAALQQSRRLSLVAERSADERQGLESARASHADLVLLPAARRAGDEIELALRAIDTRGVALFTFRERARTPASVRDAVDELSARIRRELGEPDDGATVKLATLLPRSDEAWRAYRDAVRLRSEKRDGEANAALRRALAIDPDFALAHAALAANAQWLDDEEMQRHLDAALRSLDRVPRKERLLVEAEAARLQSRIGEALQLWDRVIAGWPDDPVAYVKAGFAVGDAFADRMAAREYFERALRLPSLRRPTRSRMLRHVGRLDDAVREAQLWTVEAPGRASFILLAHTERIHGNHPAMLAAARTALAYGAPLRDSLFWDFVAADAIGELERAHAAAGERSWELLALRGRRRAALAALDAAAPPASAPPMRRAMHHNLRAAYLGAIGDADGVWREVEEQIRLGSVAAVCSAHDLAWAGDLERSRRLERLWRSDDPRLYCHRLYRAVVEWKRGDRPAALAAMRAIDAPQAAYFAGLMSSEMGDDAGAVEAFRRLRREPDWHFDGGNVEAYPRSLYFEALSLERLGEREQARKAIDRLLALWSGADRDLPLLREASALRARLRRD